MAENKGIKVQNAAHLTTPNAQIVTISGDNTRVENFSKSGSQVGTGPDANAMMDAFYRSVQASTAVCYSDRINPVTGNKITKEEGIAVAITSTAVAAPGETPQQTEARAGARVAAEWGGMPGIPANQRGKTICIAKPFE